MSAVLNPLVHGIFDPATWTVTYVVYEKEGSACAIIDSVLDYDPKSGRTSTESADKAIAFVREKNLQVQWILETHAHADHLTAVVSGGATGADTFGETWAMMYDKPVKVFKAEWERLGKKAGIMRNAEMSIYGDGLIAFWDGKSTGTAHMIRMMVNAEKWTYVVRTDIPWDGTWTLDKDGKRLGPKLNNIEV